MVNLKPNLHLLLTIIWTVTAGFSAAQAIDERWSKSDEARLTTIVNKVTAAGGLKPCDSLSEIKDLQEMERRATAQEYLDKITKISEEQLKKMGSKTIPRMVKLLNHKSYDVRWVAVLVLESFGEPAINQIEESIRSERIRFDSRDDLIFHFPIIVLSHSKTDMTSRIMNLAKSPNTNCQIFAVQALKWLLPSLQSHRIGWGTEINLSDSDISTISAFLKDENSYLRRDTINILGLLAKKHSYTIPLIIQSLEKDKSPEVRKESVEAIYASIEDDKKREKILATAKALEKASITDPDFSVRKAAGKWLNLLKLNNPRIFNLKEIQLFEISKP